MLRNWLMQLWRLRSAVGKMERRAVGAVEDQVQKPENQENCV